ncbi:MAG TPA: DUF4340 domain-containing protein [Chloroflexia bacterium]|nr:DUF4340 domain-containing protein [Chloroflexia bacterium]
MIGRNRTLIVLAVVFVILAGLSFYLQSNPATPPVPTAEPTVIVWDYSSGTASMLSVQSPTSTVTLQIQGGKWRITAPLQTDADDLQVAQVASQLKKPEARSKIGDNVTNLQQYGLATPALTVTLVLSGITPPQQQLLVGNASLDGSAYYVRPAGSNAVYLITNATIESLKGWLSAPPVAQPTPTPLPALLPPTSAITNTNPLSGTHTITGTVPLTGTQPGVGPPAAPTPTPPK